MWYCLAMIQIILIAAFGCGSGDDTGHTADSSTTGVDSYVEVTTSTTVDTAEEIERFADEFDAFQAEHWLYLEGELGATTIKVANVSVMDGALMLTVSPDPESPTTRWFGGGIESEYLNRYGVWEARIKAPEASGTICSFMLRELIELPPSELDTDLYILNQMGFKISDTTISIDSYYQWRPVDGEVGGPTHEGFYFTPFEFGFGDWHTYRMDWTPSSITFYVDGERWADVFDTSSNVNLRVHLGHWSFADEFSLGQPSATETSACLVDYVRGEGFLSGAITPEEGH